MCAWGGMGKGKKQKILQASKSRPQSRDHKTGGSRYLRQLSNPYVVKNMSVICSGRMLRRLCFLFSS